MNSVAPPGKQIGISWIRGEEKDGVPTTVMAIAFRRDRHTEAPCTYRGDVDYR